jgi:hypothetical protein
LEDRVSKFRFTAKDFDSLSDDHNGSEIAAIANQKLEEWEAASKKMYGTTVGEVGDTIKWSSSHWVNIHKKDFPRCDTHEAILWNPKPIVPNDTDGEENE